MTERETGFPFEIVEADWMPDDRLMVVGSHEEDGERVIDAALVTNIGERP